MSVLQWFKNRWLEARWGLIYVSFILSFITACTVTYADLPVVSQIFPSYTSYVVIGFVVGGLIVAPVIGYIHGKYQNPTDVLKANAPLLEKIREIYKEEKGK